MKQFEASFDVVAPKKVLVQANSIPEATEKAIAEFRSKTEPSDVRVKEIKPVVQA